MNWEKRMEKRARVSTKRSRLDAAIGRKKRTEHCANSRTKSNYARYNQREWKNCSFVVFRRALSQTRDSSKLSRIDGRGEKPSARRTSGLSHFCPNSARACSRGSAPGRGRGRKKKGGECDFQGNRRRDDIPRWKKKEQIATGAKRRCEGTRTRAGESSDIRPTSSGKRSGRFLTVENSIRRTTGIVRVRSRNWNDVCFSARWPICRSVAFQPMDPALDTMRSRWAIMREVARRWTVSSISSRTHTCHFYQPSSVSNEQDAMSAVHRCTKGAV